VKIYSYITILNFFLLCFGTLFLMGSSFVNIQTTPKWFCFIFASSAILLFFVLFSLFSTKEIQFKNFILPVCLIITGLSFTQAVYGIAQYFRLLPALGIYRVTGSLDNPAGFATCLCAGFPFFFYFLFKKVILIRFLSIAAIIIVGLAVILSGSRAGMISLAAVCVLSFFNLFTINKTQKVVTGIFLVILLSSLYFIKRDSANGRLLIWRCSWEMIKEKPITGYGVGGFKANYMNFQAKYFEEHPDSKYAMLADNISRPFNEYVGVLVNYGLAGFLCLLLFLILLIRSFKRNKEKALLSYIAAWCLIAIAVFASFSYPLRYPFIWVAGLLCCLIILFQGNDKMFKLIKKSYIPSIIILLLAPIVCFKTYSRLKAEMKWCKVAHLSLAGETEQMLPEYQFLHAKLQNNELFLYNYAAELNYSKHYEESRSIANECERFLADYDLQMLMADNYQQLKDYTKAEQHYRKAAAMCPAKFSPLYGLAKMYNETGRKDNAIVIAQQIIHKPVKIASPTVVAIRREMMQLIEENKTNKLQNNNTRQGNTLNIQSSDAALPP